MKRIFYAAFFILSPLAILSQCDPSSHDWGSATFGVSPDPTVGENFLPAVINQPYSDAVYVLCPSSVGDVVPEYANVQLAIDSISLDSVTVFNGIADVQMSTIGLYLTCNNNGESDNPCMFFPGNAYCGDIAGTPTVAGTFDVKIFVTVHFNFFGAQSLPYSFEGYVLEVSSGNSVSEATASSLTLNQNNPNPASAYTNLTFQVASVQDVTISVCNLVGEVVYQKDIKAKRGENQFRLETSAFETGVYLYSIQTMDKKLTRKMIVQH